MAHTFGAAIDVLHVQSYNKVSTKAQNKFQEALDHFLEGIPHRFYFITNNDVNEGIQQYFDSHEADMLLMLPQYHEFFDRLLHASKTKYMIFHTHKPLLAVKD